MDNIRKKKKKKMIVAKMAQLSLRLLLLNIQSLQIAVRFDLFKTLRMSKIRSFLSKL